MDRNYDAPVDLAARQNQLAATLASLGSVAVAFSGGTDSSYLLAACLDALGAAPVLAITADSPLLARVELARARAIAAQLGARHLVIASDDLDDPSIVANPPDRCYHCKLGRFRRLSSLARVEGFSALVHGENADDCSDYRPGSRAAEELGVRAPLREAALSKAHVRWLARQRGLSNWDEPSNACLASRFPYHTPLTAQALARVEAAEEALRLAFHLRQIRVRDHYPVARLEVPADELGRLAQPAERQTALALLRNLGYRYVALDLEGYRMGSLNDELDSNRRT